MDVDEALNGPDIRALLTLWDEASARETWRSVEKKASERGDANGVALARRELAEHQSVSALDALRANERIVTLLTGWRWRAMRQAREEGHSWSQIGEALQMTKQAAWEWYQRTIEKQERYAPEFLDAERARAVLTDPA